MTTKRWFTYNDVHAQCLDIVRKIEADNWKPDYIVGLTRGGLHPAVLLSHWLGVPCETLKVSLRDGGQSETNCWMADDAFGYDSEPKRILIVDDINDTGATFNWIKNDWRSSCKPNDAAWDTVWHNTVKFAVLVDNLASDAKVDYNATEINKAEHDVWMVFPWEEWWKTPASN